MAINLTDIAYQCNIIEQSINLNPVIYGALVLYFFILIGLLYFCDIKLKQKWRKNEVSEMSNVSNGHD